MYNKKERILRGCAGDKPEPLGGGGQSPGHEKVPRSGVAWKGWIGPQSSPSITDQLLWEEDVCAPFPKKQKLDQFFQA